MARASAEEKSRSRERILAAGSRLLRERGVDGTSVNDVMSAAGMTHGGFYKHFGSRDEMLGAAMHHAANAVLGPAEAELAAANPVGVVDRYVARYLSEVHQQDRANGCPLAAVAGEALRQDGAVREAAKRAFTRTVAVLSGSPVEADGEDAFTETGIATAAILIGTILLSRLASDEGDAAHIRRAGEKAARLVRDTRDRV